MNTGISLSGLTLDALINPVPLGIAAGLLLGKPLGILLFCGLALLLRIAKMPTGIGWWELIGVAILAGIGFTMSLFIAGLAFAAQPQHYTEAVLGVLGGSLVAAMLGCAWLWRVLPRAPAR